MEKPLHASVAAMVRHAWRVPADEHLSVGDLVRLGGSARSRVWRVVASRNDVSGDVVLCDTGVGVADWSRENRVHARGPSS